MFLDAIRSMIGVPRAATVEGGNWDLVDSRTGKLLTAGTETDSGITVTAETALAYHAWFRAMSLIASKSARVPKYIYKPTRDGTGKELVKNDTASRLILQQANAEQTAFQFWLQMTGHVASRGNGYAYLFRDVTRGPVIELIPLDPDKTHPVRKGGQIWYVCFPFGADASDKPLRFLSKDMLHFKGWGFDGFVGYPVWDVGRNEIGSAQAERKLVGNRFKNSGRPSMILETDKNLPVKTKDRILDEWERMHTGLDNAGKTAILDHGLKARPIAMDAEEMGQTAASQMSLVAISNYTGVPVSKLGGARSNLTQEQEDRAFITDGLGFYLDLEDDELTSKLLSDDERDAGYHVRSDREILLSVDMKTLFDVLRTATGGKPVLTQNEARERIDMPPTDEEGADELGTPLNMGQGGDQNQSDTTARQDRGRPSNDATGASAQRVPSYPLIARAARDQLAHIVSRIVKRIGRDADASSASFDKFQTFVAKFNERHERVMNQELRAISSLVSVLNAIQNADVSNWLHVTVYNDYRSILTSGRHKEFPMLVRETFQRHMLTLPQKAIEIFIPAPIGE